MIATATAPNFRIAAEQAHDLFLYQTRQDGTGFYSFDLDRHGWRGIEAAPWYRPISRVIHDFDGNEDFAYAEVVTALEALADWSDEADPFDCMDELATADIYTQDLTAWLASSAWHVEYLAEVANDNNEMDGFALLAAAQERAKREIWTGVIQALQGSAVREM